MTTATPNINRRSKARPLHRRDELQRQLLAVQDQGKCRDAGDSEEFWMDGTTPARAAALCAGCPVIEACREYALAVPEEFGVWGGLDETTRRRMVRARRSGAAVAAADVVDEGRGAA